MGKIIGAHGLRGYVRVLPYSDVPDRYRTLTEVFVQSKKLGGVRAVREAKEGPAGTWLLRLEGIEDRSGAQALRGAALLVRDQDSPRLPEGRYYVHQIIGLRVRTTDGREVGPVREVLQTGANDVYVTDAGLIPATAEVVQEVDLASGVMVVEPLPGMLDEGPQTHAD